MPIRIPETSPKRELARKVLDAVLAGVPLFGGPLAAIYSMTHPAKAELDEAEWKRVVTAKLNSLEQTLEYITKGIEVSDEAAAMGEWLCSNAKSGWGDIFSESEILDGFPDATPDEILGALGELELEGMLSISYALNTNFSHIRVTHKLYEAFDPIVFSGVSPRADAADIAEALIKEPDGVASHEFAVERGWNARRANPALGIVGEFIAAGRKSQPYGFDYGIRVMFADAREKAMLRRFVNEVRGN